MTGLAWPGLMCPEIRARAGCWLDHVSLAGSPGVIHMVGEAFSVSKRGKPPICKHFEGFYLHVSAAFSSIQCKPRRWRESDLLGSASASTLHAAVLMCKVGNCSQVYNSSVAHSDKRFQLSAVSTISESSCNSRVGFFY